MGKPAAMAAPLARADYGKAPKGEEMDRLVAEFDKMKQYILDFYSKGEIKPKHSFLGLGGHPIDCIPFEDQPGIRDAKKAKHEIQLEAPQAAEISGEAVAGPPRAMELDVQEGTPMAPQLARGLDDPLGNKRYCPEGHVPLRRVTLKQLTRFGSLEAFFRKSPTGGRADGSRRLRGRAARRHRDAAPARQPGRVASLRACLPVGGKFRLTDDFECLGPQPGSGRFFSFPTLD